MPPTSQTRSARPILPSTSLRTLAGVRNIPEPITDPMMYSVRSLKLNVRTRVAIGYSPSRLINLDYWDFQQGQSNPNGWNGLAPEQTGVGHHPGLSCSACGAEFGTRMSRTPGLAASGCGF